MNTVLEAEVPLASALANRRGQMAGPDAPKLWKPSWRCKCLSLSNFVVQYSTNLAGSNWMNLLSLTNLPASPYLFLDLAGDAEPARFYRAVMR